MEVCKKIAKVIGFFLVFIVLLLVESIKYVIKGKSIIGRIAIVLSYAGLVTAAVFKTIVFFILLAIILIADLGFSVFTAVQDGNADYSSESTRTEEKTVNGSFFTGMTLEDAKREYRRLMKQYHPDNQGGDLKMTKIISEAYREYQASYAR